MTGKTKHFDHSIPSVTLECRQLRHLVCVVHLNRTILQEKNLPAMKCTLHATTETSFMKQAAMQAATYQFEIECTCKVQKTCQSVNDYLQLESICELT